MADMHEMDKTKQSLSMALDSLYAECFAEHAKWN
ncbi:hypothetical protein VCR15J2_20793 [Vibrio coralliirubri]|nr:hypothetical protein VCR15J2_20793 [Vibrio coralliirubri]